MKTLTDAQRAAIDALHKTEDNNAEPTWKLSIFRDKEKMLGLMGGDRITSGPPDDLHPAIAQGAGDRYTLVFERGGDIYEMISSEENEPSITWSSPELLFAGWDPDIDYDGSFSTVGVFTPTNLLMVYENPQGTIKFRKRVSGTWGSAVTVGSGGNPSIVRGWADPPSVGTADMGYIVAYTRSGGLYYRYSEDQGASWSEEISINFPSGGTKRNVQVIRLSDYTHGFIYDYDTGATSEVWFNKTTRKYVNIASPDETFTIRAGSYHHAFFQLLDLDVRDHTIDVGAGGYTEDRFPVFGESFDETINPGAGEFRQEFFTGVNP